MNLGQVIAMTAFWFSYPNSKRGSKKEFAVAWGKTITPDTDLDLVYDGLDKYKAYKRWCDSRGKWLASLPHACRFISNERWWDDVPDKRMTTTSARVKGEKQRNVTFHEVDPDEFERTLNELRQRKGWTKNEFH